MCVDSGILEICGGRHVRAALPVWWECEVAGVGSSALDSRSVKWLVWAALPGIVGV